MADDEEEGGVPQYTESKNFQSCAKCCGCSMWLFFGFCTIAWIFHAIRVPGAPSDAPPFSKTLIWLSIAHHTDAWQEWQESLPPPPPSFF